MKVCFLHKIPGEAEGMIKTAGHEVVTETAGAEAIVAILTDKIDGAFMDKVGPQLKIIANYAVGYDNIDVEEAKKRNIFVTNTPGGFEKSVAEHAVGLMLAVGKKIILADRFVRAGEYERWDPNLFIGMEFSGKTIGILGMGRTGTAMGKICEAGLGMKVITCSREKESLNNLLAQADVVSLHVPLTAETRHLIGAKELSSMKKTAILINTARGAVVDEMALAKALQEKWIFGAGLDVFEDETKLVTESERILYGLDNVVLTPHIASATLEARGEMSRVAAENIIQALSGEIPPNKI
ncbi:MAG: D-glycerate dehydrogenase [Patescibacteria group bacterium]